MMNMMNTSGTSSISLAVLNTSLAAKAVVTPVYSQKYMIKLIQISILNILHHRVAIPQDQFEEKLLGTVPYKVCVRNSKNRFIRTYHALGKGITDAVEKNYLEEIRVHLTSKATKEPIETFKLKLKYYLENSKKNQKKTFKDVEDATVEYFEHLQNLELSQERKLFENECDLYCELVYKEDTPRNYQPKNFEPSNRDLSSFEPFNKTLGLGYVSSGHHKFSAWMDQKVPLEEIPSGGMEIVEPEQKDENNSEIIELSNNKSVPKNDNDAKNDAKVIRSATPKRRTPNPRKKRKTKRNLKKALKKLKTRIRYDESSSFEAELPVNQTKLPANSIECSSRNCNSTCSDSDLTLII